MATVRACFMVVLLVEDLEAVVVAVCDAQAPLRIHCPRMRGVEFARAGTLLAPGLDQLALLGELHDARVGVAAVTVADENLAVGIRDDRRRRVELVGAGAGDAGLAEPHQLFAVSRELDDLVALVAAAEPVDHPHIAIAVGVDAVREDEKTRAKTLHKPAGGVELEHRIELRAIAAERLAWLHLSRPPHIA